MHVAHGDVVAWDHDLRFRLYDCVTKRLLGVNAVITIVVLQGTGRKGGMIRRGDKVDLAADASGKPSPGGRWKTIGTSSRAELWVPWRYLRGQPFCRADCDKYRTTERIAHQILLKTGPESRECLAVYGLFVRQGLQTLAVQDSDWKPDISASSTEREIFAID